jgi:Zn-finger nucleic acid-binding protein
MIDQKDRLGDKIHDAEMARENQWARQRDEEILERLRRKYVKAINCPQCGKTLDARVAIGLGGMACPDHHGAWADRVTLDQLTLRLKNAAGIRHESLGEKVFGGLAGVVEDLRRRHPSEIDCPDCGLRLDAKTALSEGALGLAGMACPNRHGAWIDQDMLAEIRKRLDVAADSRSEDPGARKQVEVT